ncbi:MAG: hypothetical protein ACOH2H_12120 [Cypionkella sp.]
MRHFTMMAGVLAGLLLAGAAEAGPKANKDHDNGNGHAKAGHSQKGHCPPGLSNKNCTPPGLSYKKDKDHRKHRDDEEVYYRSYSVGHDLPAGYVVVFDPSLYPFWPKSEYVRYGDFFYLIDRLTRNVLVNSGPVDDWRWGWSDVDFANCPPGLAKKNPPCVPPGQAKKGTAIDPFKVGDNLPAGYNVILTPPSQTEPDTSVYARSGDNLYRVAPETGQVQQQVGVVGKLIE